MLDEPRDPPRFALLSHLALAIVLAIVIARCLMLESIRDVGGSDPNAPASPGAATSIVLDWLSFTPALLLLIGGALDRSFKLRYSAAPLLLALLAAWTLASVFWADDRFLALLSATRIAGGAALFFATMQLVSRAAHLRVVVGVVVGVLLVNVVQGWLYQNFELAQLKEFWLANKQAILAQHGWHEGDYVAQRFEMKLLAGEMLNFSVSTNVLGAVVVMAALAAIGAALQRFEDEDHPALIGALALFAASSGYVLYYTDSKASRAAMGVGIVLLAVSRWLNGRTMGATLASPAVADSLAKEASRGMFRLRATQASRLRVEAFLAVIVVIALGIAGVIALGLARGGLPTASLNFRWRYWVGSWPLVMERPLTGVGWGNFADAYLRHRLPVATEEIQDPHSFPVRWLVELGVVGLGLGIAWLIAWAWAIARGNALSSGTPRAGRGEVHRLESEIPDLRSEISDLKSKTALTLALSRGIERGDRMRIATVLLALLPALALSLACTIDFGGDGNYATLEIMRRSLFIVLIALAAGVVSVGRRASADEPFFVDERPAPWLAVGLFVGVAMLLLQSAIDMTLFQPAPWALMMLAMGALAGCSWSAAVPAASAVPPERHGVTPSMKRSMVWLAASVAGALWLASGLLVTLPVILSEQLAAMGDADMAHKDAGHAWIMYQKARYGWPVANFDYAVKEAAAYWQSLSRPPDDADSAYTSRTAIDFAIATAPQHAMNWLTRSRYISSRTELSSSDADQALSDFARGVSLNPNDVDLRIEYADLLERFSHRAEAAEQLDTALKLDDQLDPKEPERLEARATGKREQLQHRALTLGLSNR